MAPTSHPLWLLFSQTCLFLCQQSSKFGRLQLRRYSQVSNLSQTKLTKNFGSKSLHGFSRTSLSSPVFYFTFLGKLKRDNDEV